MEYEGKSLRDYVSLIKRRHKVIVFSIVVISLLGVILAYSIPAMYRSTSRFLIEQQDIPQDIVQSTVTSYVDEQIQEVRQRVMSSSKLIEVVQEHDLYPELRSAGQYQPAIEEIRANALLETEVFDVVNPRSGRAMLATISFTLSFDHENPETAQRVAADLANLYLSENIQSRTDQVQETLEFILGDIERYTQDVEHTSDLLAQFKERNLGNLPELMNYNLQSIERTERQIDAIDREIRDAQNRKLQFASEIARHGPGETVYDESGAPILNPTEQLAELQREKMRLVSVYSAEHPDVIQIQKRIDLLSSAATGTSSFTDAIEAELITARNELAESLQRYSADHPDVRRAQRTVASLENQLAQARATAGSSSASSPVSNDPYTQQLQARMDAEDVNIGSLQRRKAELQEKLADLESKVALSPQVEREYEILARNNELAIANLNDARAQLEDAQKAEKLESEGGGDRFTIVESATLPLEPYKPNRPAIILLAFVVAFGAGLVLATVLDTVDETVKDSRDVLRLIKTPPLAAIPYVESDHERRRRAMANMAMVAVVVAGVISAYAISQFAA